MRRGETASIWEALYGPNPLKERRGTFPSHWGAPPTPADSVQRRRWIAECAIRDGLAKGDGRQAHALLAARREDPAAQRERAFAETRNRLRREELAALLLPLHLRQWR